MQILSLVYEPDSYGSSVPTNVLAFAGVLLDVSTACLALLASMITQRQIHVVEQQLSAIDDLPRKSIETTIAELVKLRQSSEFVYPDIRRRAISKCEARLRVLHADDSIGTYQTHLETDFSVSDMVASSQHVQSILVIVDAAGTAMILGIFFFFASMLSLAISTQHPAVSVVSVLACSSILALPRVLGVLLRTRSYS